MPRIADLGPTELTYRAAAAYVDGGAGEEPLRLLFRALELDRFHVQAQAILAAILIDAGWREHGAALLEAALAPGRPVFGSERELLETERVRHGLFLGFSRRSAG